ncbi:Uncharacterized protein TPAR_04197, partial [Tolypocladium paradoxum]
MAIYSAVPPPEDLATGTTSAAQAPSTPAVNGAIDIDAWTISALQSLSVSPVARGTGTPLAIPIDGHTAAAAKPAARTVAFNEAATPETPRRPPSRRDSQARREALLKGNEGSRQRRRWENGTRPPRPSTVGRMHAYTLLTATDRLIGVPNVQPPLPTDWEVHPTHPIHRVPYQLA